MDKFTNDFEKLKKLKFAYMLVFVFTCLSFSFRYFGLFSKIIKNFIDIYNFYDLMAYVFVFGIVALIVLKSMINNIKDKILYENLCKLEDNTNQIKNNITKDNF